MLHRNKFLAISNLVMGTAVLVAALIKQDWLLIGAGAALAGGGVVLFSDRSSIVNAPMSLTFFTLLLFKFASTTKPAEPMMQFGAVLALVGTGIAWLLLPLLVAHARNRRQQISSVESHDN